MSEPVDYPGDVPTCPRHGDELDDGYCESCWLAEYEAALTWDAADEADQQDDIDRDMDRAA
jgi:hypothetical protein